MSSANPGDLPPAGPDHPGESPARSPLLVALRLIALVGTGAVIAWNAATSLGRLEPRQEYGLLVLVLAGLGVGFTLIVALRTATGRLFRHPDLLVPLGLYVTVEAVGGALAAVPAVAALLAPNWPVKVFSISLTLSVAFAAQVVLGVVYLGWTTTLVLQAVREDRTDLVAALAGVGRWFLRVLAVGLLGWGVLFVGLALALAVGSGAIVLALVLMAAGTLVWNLATAALLPVAVAEDRTSLGSAVRAGLRVSWAGKGRWWVPVVAQMVLLGWVTYVHVTITTNPRPGAVRTQTKSNWRVNGFWTGGYEDTCRWHADVMNTVEARPLPVVTTLLALLFTVLALAVKLRIAGDIYAARPPGPDTPNPPPESSADPA
jgi:hypothetical protein